MSTTSSRALPSSATGTVLPLALVALTAGGCLTLNPANQTKATGAPLVVDARGGSYRLLQGRSPIDEQDFYGIAGDGAAQREVRATRNDLVASQIAGQSAGAGGIGAALAGGGALAGGIVWTAQDGPIGLVLLLPGALLLTAGVVAIPVGYAMAASAADELWQASSSPLLPQQRAEAAASRYNRRRSSRGASR